LDDIIIKGYYDTVVIRRAKSTAKLCSDSDFPRVIALLVMMLWPVFYGGYPAPAGFPRPANL